MTRPPTGAATSRTRRRSRGTDRLRCSVLVDLFLGERPIAVDSERHAPAQSRTRRTTPQHSADPRVVTAA